MRRSFVAILTTLIISNSSFAAEFLSLEKYRGYSFDLSENAGRKDSDSSADMLRRQLDTVDSVGLSPRVIQFFHRVLVVASEMGCLDEIAAPACYGRSMPDGRALRGITTWDQEAQQWTNPDPVSLAAETVGVIWVRPNMLRYENDPVMLHEFLHAYHSKLMPNGFENKAILEFYSQAKISNLISKDAYAMKNHKEFFAVTASMFLSGKDPANEPFTRWKLKEQMPDYFKYLVGLFGFDPDAPMPIASAN